VASQASTTARGYGRAHQLQRAKWQTTVNAGLAHCHAKLCLMPTRWIEPGSTWDLGHTEDRTAWTGPEHTRCNRSEGSHRYWQRRARRPPRRWAL
jgi:hypothetical protein